MNVFDMPLKIAFIPDGVLPVFRLEDAAPAVTLMAGGDGLFLTTLGQPVSGEAGLDLSPTPRVGLIARRECPDRVQVLGQQDDRVDNERPTGPALAKRRAEEVSCQRIIEDRYTAVGDESKEEHSAGYEVPTVIWHPVTEAMSL
jgi:hypothetical protein